MTQQVNIDNIVTALALMKAAWQASDEQIKEIGVSREEMQVLALHFIDPQTDAMLAQVARNTLRTYKLGKSRAAAEAKLQAKANGAEAPEVAPTDIGHKGTI